MLDAPMTNRQFAQEDGFKCPFCGSVLVTIGSPVVEELEKDICRVYTTDSCRKCGKQWETTWGPVAYTELDRSL